jgi:hypothetical protein
MCRKCLLRKGLRRVKKRHFFADGLRAKRHRSIIVAQLMPDKEQHVRHAASWRSLQPSRRITFHRAR